MELNKCSRCGSFYMAEGNVCPKCSSKDALEFSTFKTYIEENGLTDSLDTIAEQTGITVRNLSRYLGSEELKDFNNNLNENNDGSIKVST